MNSFGRRRRNLLAYSAKAGLLCCALPACTPESGVEFTLGRTNGAYDETELRFLGALVETILPTTDTLGARATNAHLYIVEMLETWYRPDEAQAFRAGMAAMHDAIDEKFSIKFIDMTDRDRESAVASMLTHEVQRIRSVALQIRSMAITGYYTSEVGATVELRYSPVPGSFEPCAEFGSDDRAWWA